MKFQENLLQTYRKYENPNLPNIYKADVNIGKFGLSYFREFATDFPETSQLKEIRYDKSIHGDEFVFE